MWEILKNGLSPGSEGRGNYQGINETNDEAVHQQLRDGKETRTDGNSVGRQSYTLYRLGTYDHSVFFEQSKNAYTICHSVKGVILFSDHTRK